MSKYIHNIIEQEYEQLQKSVLDIFNERKNEVYLKNPLIKEIDHEIKTIGLKYARNILFGKSNVNDAVSELQSKIESLKAKRISLLIGLGYPGNYLDISYNCTQCKDTGFIESLPKTQKCQCYKQKLIGHLYNQSNLQMLGSQNFSAFDENFYPDIVNEEMYGLKISPRKNILEIKNRCFKFVKNFESPEEKNLLFMGNTGVGKTFMSSCIAKELLNEGKTVLYQSAPKLFDTINEYKMNCFKDENFQDSKYKNIFKVELLIIDDLGTETLSAARYAELLTILDTRHANNLTKPCKTIISTNLKLPEIKEFYTDRVLSRIVGLFDIFLFTGTDIRKLKVMAK